MQLAFSQSSSDPPAWQVFFSATNKKQVPDAGGQGQGATGASVAAPIGREVIAAVERTVR